MGIDFFKRDLSPDVVSFNFDLNKNVEISSQDFIYTKHGYKFWIDKTFVYKSFITLIKTHLLSIKL